MTAVWVNAAKNPPAIGRPVIAAAPSSHCRWIKQVARYGADGQYYVQVGNHTVLFEGVTQWTGLPDDP